MGLVKVTRFQKDFAQRLWEVISISITISYHGGPLFWTFRVFRILRTEGATKKSRKNHQAEILQLRFQQYQKIAIRSTEMADTGSRRRKI